MKAHGLQEPLFKEDGEFFKVTFYGLGERILELVKPGKGIDLRGLGSSERQIDALKYMQERGHITTKRYGELFKVTDRTALRDLNELISKGLAKREGKGKRAKYIFA